MTPQCRRIVLKTRILETRNMFSSTRLTEVEFITSMIYHIFTPRQQSRRESRTTRVLCGVFVHTLCGSGYYLEMGQVVLHRLFRVKSQTADGTFNRSSRRSSLKLPPKFFTPTELCVRYAFYDNRSPATLALLSWSFPADFFRVRSGTDSP